MTNKPKSVKAAIAGVAHALLLGKSSNTRIKRLMDIAKEMEKLADVLKVQALTEEYGEKRIEQARKEMDGAQEEFFNCYSDNWNDAIEALWDNFGEHGRLCEALDYLEAVEENEEEE